MCRWHSWSSSGAKDVLLGCIDVATERVETAEEVADLIEAALEYVPAEHLYPCTNCGMVPMARDIATRKLEALSAGAQLARSRLAARSGGRAGEYASRPR